MSIGKKGLWVPSIGNIVIIIILGIIVFVFFWWLMFGGKEKSLNEISGIKYEISDYSSLNAILRTVPLSGFEYQFTGDKEKLVALSDVLAGQKMSFADAIELSYTDKENSDMYKEIIKQQLFSILQKDYGNEFGLIVDYPEGLSLMTGFLKTSTRVSEMSIPTQDKKMINVRLVVQ